MTATMVAVDGNMGCSASVQRSHSTSNGVKESSSASGPEMPTATKQSVPGSAASPGSSNMADSRTCTVTIPSYKAGAQGTPATGPGAHVMAPVSPSPSTLVMPRKTDSFLKKPVGELATVETDGPNGLKLVALARGGYVLHGAPFGPLQFGIPPETIKDSMRLVGAKVPTNYVVFGPDSMFSRQLGLSKAEFEFPAYFNYFVLGKRVNLITTKSISERMLSVFQETLMGPDVIDPSGDHELSMDPKDYADIVAEGQYLDRDRPKTTVDKLLMFTHFNEEGVATISGDDGSSVEIRAVEGEKGPTCFEVYHEGKLISRVPFEWEPASNFRVKKRQMQLDWEASARNADHLANGVQVPAPIATTPPTFTPPQFGVTMLGSSHGFDPNGTTTGFVLWMNGRGVMVDPPPESDAVLESMGVPPLVMDGVILTHCHADHDAGTFQKILCNKRITIMTARTVFDSFLRKYSAISGFSTDFLRSVCEYRQCRVGEKVPFHGGYLKFFFSLHVIPCVGFEAHYGGKSMAYSADTITNPTLVDKMYADRVVNDWRAEQLKSFPGVEHALVLHDAGVPPIHTPISILQAMSEEVKQRLWLVHIADHTVPADSGLKVAHEGDTIVVEGVAAPACADDLEVLDLLNACQTFHALNSFRDAYNVLQLTQRRVFEPGAVVVPAGAVPDGVYLVAAGTVCEMRELQKAAGQCPRRIPVGELLGDVWLVDDTPSAYPFVAETAVSILFLPKLPLLQASRGTRLEEDLLSVVAARKAGVEALMDENKVLSRLTRAQKMQLERVFRLQKVSKGTEMWPLGETPKAVFLREGTVCVEGGKQGVKSLGRGAFIVDVTAVHSKRPSTATLRAESDLEAFVVDADAFFDFLSCNPGFLVSCYGEVWVT